MGGLLQRKKGGRGRGHTGSEEKGGGAALQVRQNALDLANGGIVRPAVAVAAPILIVGIADERACHVDRGNEASRGTIGNATRLGGDRLGVEALNGDGIGPLRYWVPGLDLWRNRLTARLASGGAAEIHRGGAGVNPIECAKAHANPP